MKNPGAIAIAALLTGIAVAGHAQQVTQSELQSKGATIVAKNDLVALVKGATLRWKNANGGEIQLKFGDDGSLVGHSSAAARGKGTNLSGTWQVTNDGKLCRDQVGKGETARHCWTVSKLDGKYFGAAGTGSAVELDITR